MHCQGRNQKLPILKRVEGNPFDLTSGLYPRQFDIFLA